MTMQPSFSLWLYSPALAMFMLSTSSCIPLNTFSFHGWVARELGFRPAACVWLYCLYRCRTCIAASFAVLIIALAPTQASTAMLRSLGRAVGAAPGLCARTFASASSSGVQVRCRVRVAAAQPDRAPELAHAAAALRCPPPTSRRQLAASGQPAGPRSGLSSRRLPPSPACLPADMQVACLDEARSVIRIEGPRLIDFLQKIIASDARQLRPGGPPLYAAVLSPQGRYLHGGWLMWSLQACCVTTPSMSNPCSSPAAP